MLDYSHRLRITRTTPGEGDGLGGTTAGETVALYDGKADVQDGGQVVQTEEGVVTEEGDATAFVPGPVGGICVGDEAAITWADGTQRGATVARVVRLDDSLLLSYD